LPCHSTTSADSAWQRGPIRQIAVWNPSGAVGIPPRSEIGWWSPESPTQVHDLTAAGLAAPPELRAIVVGGGHLDKSTGRAARDLGWPVLASYGMTEAGSQIATQGLELLETPYQPAPIALLPIWQAKTSPDGILSIAGPALFSGYLSGGVYFPRTSDHHATSDRVMLENGALTPLGRADRVVKILGELVDPEAVEREITTLCTDLTISDRFAILAMPDSRAGHTLVPVFESHAAAATMGPALNSYQLTAPGFRRLGPAVIAGAFPRSPLGKLRRAELAEAVRKTTSGDF
jgi:o-succinylbenzoate---CoA ligase